VPSGNCFVRPGTNKRDRSLKAFHGTTMTKSNDHLGPVSESGHLSVAVQRMLTESTEREMPWFPRILPNVIAIRGVRPSHTIFPRFIHEQKPHSGIEWWKHYHERGPTMSIEQLGLQMVDLVSWSVGRLSATWD